MKTAFPLTAAVEMIYQPNESPAMRPAAALAPIVKPGSGKAPLHYHPPCGPGAVAEGKGYGCGREKGGSEIEHGGGSKTRFLPTFCYRFLPGRNFFFPMWERFTGSQT